MDILIFETGWMEAICGPMFSGKSEELIRRLRRPAIARKRVQVFKPSMDTRYSECEIVTHADTRMRSEPVASAREMLVEDRRAQRSHRYRRVAFFRTGFGSGG